MWIKNLPPDYINMPSHCYHDVFLWQSDKVLLWTTINQLCGVGFKHVIPKRVITLCILIDTMICRTPFLMRIFCR